MKYELVSCQAFVCQNHFNTSLPWTSRIYLSSQEFLGLVCITYKMFHSLEEIRCLSQVEECSRQKIENHDCSNRRNVTEGSYLLSILMSLLLTLAVGFQNILTLLFSLHVVPKLLSLTMMFQMLHVKVGIFSADCQWPLVVCMWWWSEQFYL